jgi:hypothetical protein
MHFSLRSRSLSFLVVAILMSLVTANAFATINVSERQVYTDVSEDIEPAVMATSVSGVDYTCTVFMKFLNQYQTLTPHLYYSTYNSNGQVRANPLSTLSGYDRNADPVMAKNSTATYPSNRIYLAGTAYNSTITPNAIAAWYSDDGGFTWSSPSAVVAESTGSYFLDKPAITVSSETNSSGYIYIAYVRVNDDINDSQYGYGQVNVMASANGGVTWQGPFAVGTNQPDYEAPQVMVDNSTGNVYVVWADLGQSGNGSIRIASSGRWDPYRTGTYNPATAMSFTESTALTTGILLGGTHTNVIATGTGVSLMAQTCPVAKLDSAHGRISVAWHEANGTTSTRLQFVTRPLSGSWGTPITLAATTGHSVMPGMDYDGSGNFMVTYYSFAQGSSNYNEAAAYVTFSGNTPSLTETKTNVSSFSSTLASYSSYPTNGSTRHLGEYQDVFFYNGSWRAAGIGISTYGNPYVWTLTHS